MAENLIASSEFDPANFLKGFQAMTAGVEAFIKKEQELTATLDRQEKELQDNQKALAATKAQIDGLDKSAATYARDLAALNKQQVEQKQANQQQQQQIKATRLELEGTSKTVKEYTISLKNLGLTVKQVSDQNKGKSLFDVSSLAANVNKIQQAGSRLREIFAGGIDDDALRDLEARVAGAKDEFEQLGQVIDFIKQKMNTLDPQSAEFAELAEVVRVGEEVLKDFGKVNDEVAKKSVSMRGRLRELREELARMEDAGQENTEQFQQMQIEAGRLSDTIGDASERIKVLASDTKALDFGLSAIRGAVAGFTLVAGATELLGLKNEDTLKTIARLNALMAVLNGLQEISNLLKKQSVLLIVGEEIATKALAATQRILAATIGTTAAATKGLNIALLSTGVGALVVVIGYLVEAFSKWEGAAEKTTRQQKELNAATDYAIKSNERLIDAIASGNEKRIAAIELEQELNKDLLASDTKQMQERIRNAQALRDAEIESTRQQVAAVNTLEAAQRAAFENAKARRKELLDTALRAGVTVDKDILKELETTIANFLGLQQSAFDLRARLSLQETQNLRDAARERNEFRLLEIRQTEDYMKRLRELQQRLQDAQNKGQVQNAAQLQKQAALRLQRELEAIDRDVEKGNLTDARGKILKGLLKQISGVEFEAELKEFNRRVLDATRQLDEQITNLRLTAATQRAELIRDELTREAATIEAAAKEERVQLIQERQALLRDIREQQREGLISEALAQENADKVMAVYNELLLQLSTRTRRAQEELQARAFELAQEQARRTFAQIGLELTQETTKEIIDLAQRFGRGAITYEKYQKELTKIAEAETQKRIGIQITEANALLFNTNQRLRNEQDPQRKKALEDQVIELQARIAELQRQLAEARAKGIQGERGRIPELIEEIAKYAQAIQGITNSVVGFWQAANDAEQKALERSISLQQKRVDAATRLAERGNAEYLRLEEDRLRELEIKQENAARRQLAINAVLQTSQALTAFVGALAQGISVGGPVGGIAIAGAVLALLASGYAIIQNLQKNNVQRLYKGTRRVKAKNGEPDGVDTVPAMLTKDEAVVPADKNAAYSDTMDAVFDGTVPPEVLNRFVRNYHNYQDMPQLDYVRMEKAMAHSDRGLTRAMQEQNDLIRQQNGMLTDLNQAVAGSGVDLSLDKHGFAVSVMGALKKINLVKKA
jgi:hypothetical protein